jgi:transcriptional regulator with XRE-family HTH domain
MNTNRETGPETIDRILSAYELGRKLHQLRMRKKIALVELGKHTGLSPSMLSQLENGRLTPTLPTLARISMVFDVSLDYFFSQKRGAKLFAVVRAGERMRFPDRPDSPAPSFFFECLTFASEGKGLQAYIADFPHRKHSEVREHFHEGSEFVHVLEGVLEIHFQGEDHALKAGDSVHFDSSEPHSYRGTSKHGARAIVITSAPRI